MKKVIQPSAKFAGLTLPIEWVARLHHTFRRSLVVFAGDSGSQVIVPATAGFLESIGKGMRAAAILTDSKTNVTPLREGLSDKAAATLSSMLEVEEEADKMLRETGVIVNVRTDDPQKIEHHFMSLLRMAVQRVLIEDFDSSPETLKQVQKFVMFGTTVFATMHAESLNGAIERLNHLEQTGWDIPVVVIHVKLVKEGDHRVPIVGIHTRADRALNRFPHLSLFRCKGDERRKPIGVFTAEQHVTFLAKNGSLSAETINAFKQENDMMAGEESALKVLQNFEAPRELRPVEYGEELLREVETLISIDWSIPEIAAKLVFAGFDASAEDLQNALELRWKLERDMAKRNKTARAKRAAKKGPKKRK